MAKGIHRLPNNCKNLPAGMHGDGGNLWLQCTARDGAVMRSWIFRFKLPGGKARAMGLGSLNDLPLADAREQARLLRLKLKDGIDPIEERDRSKSARIAAARQGRTFEECAKGFMDAKGEHWTAQHFRRWKQSLKDYAYPTLGALNVEDINVDLVEAALRPIWTSNTKTASDLRGRIENILDWATVKKYRTGDNPARWKGCLEYLFVAREKVTKVEPHASLAYADMPAFYSKLDADGTAAGLALQLLILSGVRTIDVREAKIADFDLEAGMWTIPELSKVKHEHKVPLSPAAVSVVKVALRHKARNPDFMADSEYLFPNQRNGGPMATNSMLNKTRALGYSSDVMDNHGLRSTFSTWGNNETQFESRLIDMAIGHKIGDAVERAYNRADYLAKRLALMTAWASFLTGKNAPADNVTAFPLKSA
ncbi:site-specific integrase [Rhizobium sp. BG4]|uniref:tyrosine-type recombinase/integrase n=1 Tax=Rhizobium sp. BG4 TaxID=2613770 RepID=UPI00193E2847|nr:site-specific integrase [Rhizobium sp. BG4]QRM45361.1 tyrosine-type recombinase/integrase [Rhizobium sp. BG4]